MVISSNQFCLHLNRKQSNTKNILMLSAITYSCSPLFLTSREFLPLLSSRSAHGENFHRRCKLLKKAFQMISRSEPLREEGLVQLVNYKHLQIRQCPFHGDTYSVHGAVLQGLDPSAVLLGKCFCSASFSSALLKGGVSESVWRNISFCSPSRI